MILKVLLIFITLGWMRGPDSEPVAWSKDRKLGWTDFQAKAPKQDPHAAKSRVEVQYQSQVDKTGQMTMNIESMFIKELSWVKSDGKKDQILVHEQYHFNITEVWARKLRKEILSKKWNKKNLEKDFNKLFKNTMGLLLKEQLEYDNKTNHSKERDTQSEWEKKIDKDLSALNNFSKTAVAFSFE